MEYDIKEVTTFFEIAFRLKKVLRKGWKLELGITRPESVADHSYAMCIISMLISDMLGMDTERMMKMVCLHDLAEAIIGDLTPSELSNLHKKKLEDRAIRSILTNVPKSIRRKYCSIWKEYFEDRTKLSHIVHRIDKVEMAFQARNYLEQGYSEHLLNKFLSESHRIVSKKDTILYTLLQTLNSIK